MGSKRPLRTATSPDRSPPCVPQPRALMRSDARGAVGTIECGCHAGAAGSFSLAAPCAEVRSRKATGARSAPLAGLRLAAAVGPVCAPSRPTTPCPRWRPLRAPSRGRIAAHLRRGTLGRLRRATASGEGGQVTVRRVRSARTPPSAALRGHAGTLVASMSLRRPPAAERRRRASRWPRDRRWCASYATSPRGLRGGRALRHLHTAGPTGRSAAGRPRHRSWRRTPSRRGRMPRGGGGPRRGLGPAPRRRPASRSASRRSAPTSSATTVRTGACSR